MQYTMEMATLGQCSHFPISSDRRCCRSLNVLWNLLKTTEFERQDFRSLRITRVICQLGVLFKAKIATIMQCFYISSQTWWRHQMETFSALLAICAGNSPVPGEFPTQRPVTRSFDIYFDLGKQPWAWWFETLSCSLWRHRNGINCWAVHSLPWLVGVVSTLVDLI